MNASANSVSLEVRNSRSVRYELEPLTNEEQATWDARIAGYETNSVFEGASCNTLIS